MKLYELSAEYRLLEEAIVANGGELGEELSAALDYIQDQFIQKAESIWALADEAAEEEETYRRKAREFGEKARAAANRAASLKDYLMRNMKRAEVDRIKGRLFAISIAKSGRPVITWPHGSDIPEGFRRVKVELDGDRAWAAYKEGQLPEGFEVRHSEHLRAR
jgi:hypothetical protein